MQLFESLIVALMIVLSKMFCFSLCWDWRFYDCGVKQL